jgi:hypothetical protein
MQAIDEAAYDLIKAGVLEEAKRDKGKPEEVQFTLNYLAGLLIPRGHRDRAKQISQVAPNGMSFVYSTV